MNFSLLRRRGRDIPCEGPLVFPTKQPWFGRYHFRFEVTRDDGSIATKYTKLTGMSQEACEKRLQELLGCGRYRISFVGMETIPFEDWPRPHLKECGISLKDLRRNPSPFSAG